MARKVDISIDLGSANTGLVATLRAQLVNSNGTLTGSEISTGFIEIGNGQYLWNYVSVPDTFRGGVSFYISPAVYTSPSAFISLVSVVDTLEAADVTGGADVDAIADAVWDELRSGHTTTGSFGDDVVTRTEATADKDEIISSGDSNKDDIISVIPSASDTADAVRVELAIELARIDKPISDCCPDQGDIEITLGDSSPDISFTAG